MFMVDDRLHFLENRKKGWSYVAPQKTDKLIFYHLAFTMSPIDVIDKGPNFAVAPENVLKTAHSHSMSKTRISELAMTTAKTAFL